MDWTAGYVADIGYSSQYYSELNPVRLSLALLNAGYAPPKVRYACELGFGQGVSVNIHAAAEGETRWYGNDFIPSHAAFAQGLAAEAGAGAELTDESFAEFFARTDLPDFDFICLHGIWSWISDENRALIVDFLRRKLRVGGVAYISYNTLPGWAAAMPMRELFAQHAKHMSPPALDSVAKVEAALAHVSALFASQPGYTVMNPMIAERFEKLKDMDRRYLAHEYFNRNWRPMYFTEIAEALSAAKLTFACSANYADLLDEIWMTPEQQALLDQAPNEALTQLTRDYIVNQQFRRDIWIKGGDALPPGKALELLGQHRVVLTAPLDRVVLSTKMGGRDITLQETVYRPLLDLLADHQPHRIADLSSRLAGQGIAMMQVIQAVMVLISLNHVAPAQGEAEVKASIPTARRINAAVVERARYGDAVACLASPVTGGGMTADHMALRILGALEKGADTPAKAAQAVWEMLQAEGRVMTREGKPLETAEENLAELARVAETFIEQQWPLLQKLGVSFNEIRTQSRHSRKS